MPSGSAFIIWEEYALSFDDALIHIMGGSSESMSVRKSDGRTESGPTNAARSSSIDNP